MMKRIKLSPGSSHEAGDDSYQQLQEDEMDTTYPIVWSCQADGDGDEYELDDGEYGDEGSESSKASGQKYWKTPGAEEKLCRLWEQNRNLYDSHHPEHRDHKARKNSLKEISNILKIPVKYVNMRMCSLRTTFQRTVKDEAKGILPKKTTLRTQQILNICSFLKEHVKDGTTSVPRKVSSRSPFCVRSWSSKANAEAYSSEGSTGYMTSDNMHEYENSAEGFREEDESKKWFNGSARFGVNQQDSQQLNTLSNVMQDWTQTLGELTKNVEVLSEAALRSQAAGPESAETLWAKSLVPHMLKMDSDTKKQFMLHVYQLAFDAGEGKWRKT